MRDIRNSSRSFAEADADGNQHLDFEEFLAMQPRQVLEAHSNEELRQLFDAADVSGDGMLSIDEWFLFSLGQSAQEHGASTLEAVFEKYDRNRSGTLDSDEFESLCRNMGFGSESRKLFTVLDHDNSGSLSYRELAAALAAGDVSGRLSSVTKRRESTKVAAFVWAHDGSQRDSGRERRSIDTSNWRLRGQTTEAIRDELRDLLQKCGGHIADLIRIFDTDEGDAALLIDDVEFYKAMRERLGYRGPTYVLRDVFRSLDSDGSGAIGFDELFEFVRGRRLTRARTVMAISAQCPLTLAHCVCPAGERPAALP
jgi:Ca2+-binding EF-hand superfamily protein